MQRLSPYQIMMLLGLYLVCATLGPPSAQMIALAGQDAWLSYLPGLALTAGLIWLIAAAQARNGGQDLMAALVARYPVAGRAIAGLYAIFGLVVLARDLRTSADFVNISLLQRTPLLVLTFALAATAILVAKAGNAVIGSLAELFSPVLIGISLALLVMTANQIQTRHLFPVLEYGVGRVFAGSLLTFPYLGEAVLLLLACPGGALRLRDGLRGLLLGGGQLLVLVVTDLLILGPQLAHRFMYPNYEVIRQIRITDFLDRWDLFIVAGYYPALLVRLGVGLYIVCRFTSLAVPNVSSRTIATPLGGLALVSALWIFRDAVQILALNRVWWVVALPFEVILPLLISLLARPKQASKTTRAL